MLPLPQLRLATSLAIITPVLAGLNDLAHCDPLKKDTRCPPDPAFAGKASFNFNNAGWDDDLARFWAVDSGSEQDNRHIDFDTDGKGAAFGVWAEGQAPTLTSNRYLLFGKVTVEVLAAQGPGLITAIVLKSDSGDEIDWELLGAYEKQAQTNYFYDGQALFNTYNDTYALDASSFAAWHTYSVEWTSAYLRFSIDGAERKTWRVGDIPAEKWPQTPMQVKLGVWSVGQRSDPGEIAWAGGVPDWKANNSGDDDNDKDDKDKDKGKTPSAAFKAYFKTLELEDLLGGCSETSNNSDSTNDNDNDNAAAAAVEYHYDERTKGWQDIRVKGCKKRVVPGVFPLPPDASTDGVPQPTNTDGDGSANPPPTSTVGQPPSRTGDEDAPSESGESSGGGGGSSSSEDDQGSAPLARKLSSPLAAVVLLGWLLML